MKLNKGKKLTKEDKAKVSQLYLNAKEEWNERFGSYKSQEKNWRIAFFTSLVILIISVLASIYLSTQSKFIPYIVEVDREGRTLEVIQAEKVNIPDERIIKASIYNFIKNFRLVTRDVELQKQAITSVFACLSDNSPAYNYVVHFYQKDNPYKLAKDSYTATTNIHQILPLSQKTWRVDWEENRFSLNGEVISKINYSATMSIMLGAKINTNTILLNPAGFYITNIDFEKDFFKKDKPMINKQELKK